MSAIYGGMVNDQDLKKGIIHYDVDWFACDSTGAVAHFASAGKRLPLCVTSRICDHAKLLSILCEDKPNLSAFSLHPQLQSVVSAPNIKALDDFIQMAGRGLYSFDTSAVNPNDLSYFCVAIPQYPLNRGAASKTIAELMMHLPKVKGLFAESFVLYNNDFK